MRVCDLMKLSAAKRTDWLESLAHKEGLRTAPGPRCEGRVLHAALSSTDIGIPGTMHGPDILPMTLWAHYLRAPFLLLRQLELFQPALLNVDRPLRVLMLGADSSEVLDEGRWYALAWRMRYPDQPPPQIIAVGPSLSRQAQWGPSQWAHMVERLAPTLEMLPGALSQYFIDGDDCVDWDCSFDVAVMNHPGFVAYHHAWWEDDAWLDLAGFSEIPLVGASFDATDLAYDRHGLAASGRQLDEAWWNPTAHIQPAYADPEFNGVPTRLQWGAVLWSASRNPGMVEGKPEPESQRAVDWFARWHYPLVMTPQGLSGYFMYFYSCPMQLDALHQKLMISDDIMVDIRTGHVSVFSQEISPGPRTLELLSATTLERRLELGPAVLEEIWPLVDLPRLDADFERTYPERERLSWA